MLQMRVVLGRFEGLHIADIDKGRAMRGLGAVLGRIDLAQSQRVDAQLAGQFVDAAFDPKRRDRRARRRDRPPPWAGSTRRRSRLMLTFGRSYMAKPHMQPGPTGEPGNAPAWNFNTSLRGDDVAILFGAELDSMTAARSWTGAAKHLFAAHHHLDRPPRFFRQGERHGLEIDQRLAAEPAADLGRHRADIGDVGAEQFGAIGADQ